MSSSVASNRVENPWKTGRTSLGWEEEGRPVAPILSGKQKLPSNLKLAVEASSQGEGEGLEEEVEGDGECMRPIYVRGMFFLPGSWSWRYAGFRQKLFFVPYDPHDPVRLLRTTAVLYKCSTAFVLILLFAAFLMYLGPGYTSTTYDTAVLVYTR